MDQLVSHIAQLTQTEWLLCGGLLFFFLIQLFFYLFIYSQPHRYEKKRAVTLLADDQLPGISVIITSKNDAEELEKNLPYILEQNYPEFEVIVVNSRSTDETDMVLKAAEQKYPRLYHTYVPANADPVNEKKLALTIGIKAAKYETLLFTEAYCRPCSGQWIREYGKEFTKGREVVLGYSRLLAPGSAAWHRFIQFDNLVHHLKFLSMALIGKPYMAIGRNMAYKKALFFEQKGFSPILNIEGGEDDLFINRIARDKNTGVVLSESSITETNIVDTFSTWRALKSTYAYTKQFYKGFGPHLFGWETVSRYAFYLALLALVGAGIATHNIFTIGVGIVLFLCRFFVQLAIINGHSHSSKSKKYHLDLILFDLFQPICNQQLKRYANQRNKQYF